MRQRKVSVTVFRYDPKTDLEPHYEVYDVPHRSGMAVLDALIYIHEHLDSSLAFQYYCRSQRCGTCAVLVNGIPSLSCKRRIEDDIEISPLPNSHIIRDLVVDISDRDRRILKIEPFQRTKEPGEEQEVLPADLVQKYIALTTCISCGICLSACPVTRETSSFAGPDVLLQLARGTYDPRVERNGGTKIAHQSLGLYLCTTCSGCQIFCPKELNPVELIVDLRSMVVEEGSVAPTTRDALESVHKRGNPWGAVRRRRSDWAEALNVKHVSQGAEILYYVGCTSAYDPRVQQVARSFVKCLDKAGTRFGILGDEENCCGSEVYGMGEKGLFNLLVEENTEIFNKYNIKEVVTTCPHGYNVLKSRYGQEIVNVKHHTQLLANLIESRKLTFSKETRAVITYQDPCFLGKQNGIYDEPRKIIKNIPGVDFVELDSCKERSLCCGGGGGRMWINISKERLAEIRIKEAVETGAEMIATACPFCLLSLEDAAKTMGFEGKIRVIDIAELVSEAI